MEESWTIAVNRQRLKSQFRKPKTLTLTNLLPSLLDSPPDPQSQSRILLKVNSSFKRLENSPFFAKFSSQLKNPRFRHRLSRVLGSCRKTAMVIYGIGSIECSETSRLQLSLAILLRRDLEIELDIEVFDPVISATESRVFESFGCKVISIDERGKRVAEIEPLLFFMPHCEAFLYDNLLLANWRCDLLRRIVILGNSFRGHGRAFSVCKGRNVDVPVKFILRANKCVDEFPVEVDDDDFFSAFHETSWHFYELNEEDEHDKMK